MSNKLKFACMIIMTSLALPAVALPVEVTGALTTITAEITAAEAAIWPAIAVFLTAIVVIKVVKRFINKI